MTYHWEYGLTTSYGSVTPTRTVADNATNVNASEAITGLTINTLYHCRLVVIHPLGTFRGADETFTTTSSGTGTIDKPTITSEAVAPYDTLALVTAMINPNGSDTTYWVEYGQNIPAQIFDFSEHHDFYGGFAVAGPPGSGAVVNTFDYRGQSGVYGSSIGGFLVWGWKVKCIEAFGEQGGISVGQVYTLRPPRSVPVTGSANTFSLDNSNGTGVVVVGQPSIFRFVLAGMVKGDPRIRGTIPPGLFAYNAGGDNGSPAYIGNVPVKMNWTDGSDMPSNIVAGQQYYAVRNLPVSPTQSVGFFKISATSSGTILTPNEDSFPSVSSGALHIYNNLETLTAPGGSIILGSAGNTAIQIILSGLKVSTEYYYRVKAVNGIGQTTTSDHTFTTSAYLNWAAQNFEKIEVGTLPNPTNVLGTVQQSENHGDTQLGGGRRVVPQYNYSAKDFESESAGTITAPTAGTNVGDTSTSTGRFV